MWPFVSFIHHKSLDFPQRIRTDGGKKNRNVDNVTVVFIACCLNKHLLWCAVRKHEFSLSQSSRTPGPLLAAGTALPPGVH